MPYLEKAHALQPDDMEIATAFADTLLVQHELERAEPVYQALLTRYRTLAQQKPAAWQPSIARTLGKLGGLYVMRQQQREAEAAWLHALEIYWALARVNPSAYSPAAASTIDSLASLYRDTQRPQEAADPWREALALALDRHSGHSPHTVVPATVSLICRSRKRPAGRTGCSYALASA